MKHAVIGFSSVAFPLTLLLATRISIHGIGACGMPIYFPGVRRFHEFIEDLLAPPDSRQRTQDTRGARPRSPST